MICIPRPCRRGFTLFELLVVLALLVVLLGLALPAVQKVREAAARTSCTNNLHQMTIALHNCDSTYAKLPPAVGPFPAKDGDGTVHFYLLPFIEQDNVYKNAADAAGVLSVWNNGTYSVKIPTYFCPSDASADKEHLYDGWLGTTSYAANYLVLGLGGASLGRIPDGTSNTMAFAERYQICNSQPCAWGYSGETEWAPLFAYSSVAKFQTQPTKTQCNPALAQSVHSAGIQVTMCDGSVRLVNSAVSPRTWYCACDPSDGIPLGPDW